MPLTADPQRLLDAAIEALAHSPRKPPLKGELRGFSASKKVATMIR